MRATLLYGFYPSANYNSSSTECTKRAQSDEPKPDNTRANSYMQKLWGGCLQTYVHSNNACAFAHTEVKTEADLNRHVSQGANAYRRYNAGISKSIKFN